MPITLAAWNVNSIKMRSSHVRDFLTAKSPDILMLQELKGVTDAFPHELFADYPHHIVVGQPAYNGVAILSRLPFDVVHTALPAFDDTAARYIEIKLAPPHDFHVINIYAPNGNPVDSDKYPYKLRWLDGLRDRAASLLRDRTAFLIAGDYNVIPDDLDCWDPTVWRGDALFRTETWQRWRALKHLGLTDAFRALHPETRDYSFWDYQGGAWDRDHGIRIDHVLLSPGLADRLQSCAIDRTPRGQDKPSDHTPVLVTLA